MTKLAIISLAALLLVGCGSAYDPAACKEEVRKAFPSAEIYEIRGNKYEFVVKNPNGEYYRVSTLSMVNTDITHIERITGMSTEEKAKAIIEGKGRF